MAVLEVLLLILTINVLQIGEIYFGNMMISAVILSSISDKISCLVGWGDKVRKHKMTKKNKRWCLYIGHYQHSFQILIQQDKHWPCQKNHKHFCMEWSAVLQMLHNAKQSRFNINKLYHIKNIIIALVLQHSLTHKTTTGFFQYISSARIKAIYIYIYISQNTYVKFLFL